jgi:hypothetical protein
MRAMVNEKTKQIAEEALDQLAAALQAGKNEALNRYLAAVGRFHRYSWNNVLLIPAAERDACRWVPHVARLGALCQKG